TFVFDGGDTLTLDQVKAQLAAQVDHSGQEVIDLGTLPAGVPVEATPGNDTFYMTENSTVVFRSGDGIDRIAELPSFVRFTQHYTIQFADLSSTQADVWLYDANSQDIAIAFPSGDEVVLAGAANGFITPTIRFDDGVVWDAAKLAQTAIDREVASGAPLILGTARDDVINAGPGTHEVQGSAGNDTFLFHRGDGQLTVADASGTDTLRI